MLIRDKSCLALEKKKITETVLTRYGLGPYADISGSFFSLFFILSDSEMGQKGVQSTGATLDR